MGSTPRASVCTRGRTPAMAKSCAAGTTMLRSASIQVSPRTRATWRLAVTATATDHLEYVWPRLSLWRLSIPQPAICVRRPPNTNNNTTATLHMLRSGGNRKMAKVEVRRGGGDHGKDQGGVGGAKHQAAQAASLPPRRAREDVGRDQGLGSVGCSTNPSRGDAHGEACVSRSSFTKLYACMRSSFWLILRPSLYREADL